MNRLSGIYEIKNKLSSDRYIGSSKNVSRRLRCHKYNLQAGKHPNPHLQCAWNKYGEPAFEFNLLFECQEEFLLDEEQKLLDENPVYNIAGNSIAPMRGRKLSEEHKRILLESWKGKTHSEETKRKISESLMGHLGSMLGQPRSEETKRKISAKRRGKKHSDEAKKRISESQKGRVPSEETKRKISSSHLGIKFSDERKRKISEGVVKRYANKGGENG